MKPSILGKKYDKIAKWWRDRHLDSAYGVGQLERALNYIENNQEAPALDVGCGAGGRMVNALQDHGFAVTGVDVSKEMINLARQAHPNETFIHHDICSWEANQKYDFIVAWDSLFHLPLDKQQPISEKLCALLNKKGILIYSFGNAEGEHSDQWRGDTFHYSSLGINANTQLLLDNDMTILHLELDQYPEKHVYVIARKD